MVQNCFTALGDTMSKRFEREGYSWPSAVLQSTDYCHSAEQTLLATSGHPEPSVPFINFTLRTCPSLLRLSANESNAAISIVWFIGCYSLQRQGRLGKTPRLGPRGQFSEARSFHSFNENVALHIISYYVALPETNIERKSTCMMSKFRIDLMKPLQKLPNGIHAEALALCTMLLDGGVPLNHADVAWLQLCMFSLRLCCWNSAVLLWYLGQLLHFFHGSSSINSFFDMLLNLRWTATPHCFMQHSR